MREVAQRAEREKIIDAMERAGWMKAKAARLLGLTPPDRLCPDKIQHRGQKALTNAIAALTSIAACTRLDCSPDILMTESPGVLNKRVDRPRSNAATIPGDRRTEF
ncbi:MAG: helix-turn-helix domain-containing protein [Methylocystis sp.]